MWPLVSSLSDAAVTLLMMRLTDENTGQSVVTGVASGGDGGTSQPFVAISCPQENSFGWKFTLGPPGQIFKHVWGLHYPDQIMDPRLFVRIQNCGPGSGGGTPTPSHLETASVLLLTTSSLRKVPWAFSGVGSQASRLLCPPLSTPLRVTSATAVTEKSPTTITVGAEANSIVSLSVTSSGVGKTTVAPS